MKMANYFRFAVTFGALVLVSGGGACRGDCTMMGCMSGLWVTLASAPSMPYAIEVYSEGGPERYVFTCARADGCGGTARFADFRPARAFVEVIAGADTSRYEVTGPIHYDETYPNGRHCGGACYLGTVTVP